MKQKYDRVNQTMQMRLCCNGNVKYSFEIELQDFISEQVPTRNYQKYFAVETEEIKKLAWELVFTLGVHESTDRFGEVDTAGMLLKDWQGLILPPPAYFSYEPLPLSWEKILSKQEVVNPKKHTPQMDEFGQLPIYKRDANAESSKARLHMLAQNGYPSNERSAKNKSRLSRGSEYNDEINRRRDEEGTEEDYDYGEEEEEDYEYQEDPSRFSKKSPKSRIQGYKSADNLPEPRTSKFNKERASNLEETTQKKENPNDINTEAGDDRDTNYRGSKDNAHFSGGEDSLMAELDEYNWKLNRGVSKVIGTHNK